MGKKNNRRRNMTRKQREQAIEKVLTQAFFANQKLTMGQIADRLEIARSSWLMRILEDMAVEQRIYTSVTPRKTGVSDFTFQFTVGPERARQLARSVWEHYAA